MELFGFGLHSGFGLACSVESQPMPVSLQFHVYVLKLINPENSVCDAVAPPRAQTLNPKPQPLELFLIQSYTLNSKP